MDENGPAPGRIAVVVSVVGLVVAAVTGWHTATAYVGFMFFLVGWIVYGLLALFTLVLGVIAIAKRRGRAFGIVSIVLATLGGPASCTGALAMKDHCRSSGWVVSDTGRRSCW